jgi:hypothetical protein
MVGPSLQVVWVDNWVILGIEFLGCVIYYNTYLMPIAGAAAGNRGKDGLLVDVEL